MLAALHRQDPLVCLWANQSGAHGLFICTGSLEVVGAEVHWQDASSDAGLNLSSGCAVGHQPSKSACCYQLQIFTELARSMPQGRLLRETALAVQT